MDWSETDSCIKCDKGGNVLVCSENGCPLAVHEGCLGYPASLDDAGCFHCPYCLYKQAVAESRKAREYALARKKALLIFMDGSEKDMGENKARDDNGDNQLKISGSDVKDASCDYGKSKSNNGGIIDEPFVLGEEEKIRNAEEDSESSAGSKGKDPSLEMNRDNGDRTFDKKHAEEEHEASVDEENIQEEREASVEEGNIQEEEPEASVDEENIQEEEREASVEEGNIQEEEPEASVEEENTQEEECETSSASTNQDPSFTVHARANIGSKRNKPVDKDSEAVSMQSKLLKQHGKMKQASPAVTPTRRSSRRSSSARRAGKVVNGELGSPRRLRKPEEPSEKLHYTLRSEKRRRLMWTDEEEEALRAGVKKHSEEAKIPWMKILEESDKFDATRTPSDLRDKWRKGKRRR